jgi:S-adenosylmethionine hydrolase
MSDFGIAGDFVGSCKGVMVGIAPAAPLVDISHDIPEFQVTQGAEVLQHATRYMPAGAVYLAVVDPGVGTQRRALALEAGGGEYLVGPDNGLLIPAAEALGGIARVVHLTERRYQIEPVSNTFHGRDVFAPAAAYLAAGVELAKLGEEVDPATLKRVTLPGAERDGGVLVAEIIDIDRYGNARLSATHEDLGLEYGSRLSVRLRDEKSMKISYEETFGSAKVGDLVLVPDSHWRLSLAVNKGHAASALFLSLGDKVRLELPEGDRDER